GGLPGSTTTRVPILTRDPPLQQTILSQLAYVSVTHDLRAPDTRLRGAGGSAAKPRARRSQGRGGGARDQPGALRHQPARRRPDDLGVLAHKRVGPWPTGRKP